MGIFCIWKNKNTIISNHFNVTASPRCNLCSTPVFPQDVGITQQVNDVTFHALPARGHLTHCLCHTTFPTLFNIWPSRSCSIAILVQERRHLFLLQKDDICILAVHGDLMWTAVIGSMSARTTNIHPLATWKVRQVNSSVGQTEQCKHSKYWHAAGKQEDSLDPQAESQRASGGLTPKVFCNSCNQLAVRAQLVCEDLLHIIHSASLLWAWKAIRWYYGSCSMRKSTFFFSEDAADIWVELSISLQCARLEQVPLKAEPRKAWPSPGIPGNFAEQERMAQTNQYQASPSMI